MRFQSVWGVMISLNVLWRLLSRKFRNSIADRLHLRFRVISGQYRSLVGSPLYYSLNENVLDAGFDFWNVLESSMQNCFSNPPHLHTMDIEVQKRFYRHPVDPTGRTQSLLFRIGIITTFTSSFSSLFFVSVVFISKYRLWCFLLIFPLIGPCTCCLSKNASPL